MKKLFSIFLSLALIAAAQNVSTGPVTKTTSGANKGDLLEDLNVGSGRTAQVKSGGTLNGAGTFDFHLGTLTLADNQVGWLKLSKSGSSLADLATRSATDLTLSGVGLLGRTSGGGAAQELSASTVKTFLALSNVDNTSDANKPVSTAQATADALNLKIASNFSDINDARLGLQNLAGVRTVATVAALKALSVASLTTGFSATLSGYYATGDGGGGIVYYDSASSATSDDFRYFTPTVGAGRWIRVSAAVVDARQGGASSSLTNAQNSTKIQAVVDAVLPGQVILVPPEINYVPGNLSLKGRRLSNYSRAKYLNAVATSGLSTNAHMTVSEGFLYVCEYSAAKVSVYSLADPSVPRLINSFTTASAPRDIRVVGRFAFVACHGAAKVEVYDLTILGSPSLVGYVATGGNPKTLEIVGNKLFVACNSGTWETYQITSLTGSGITIGTTSSVAMTSAIDNAYNPQNGIFAVTKGSGNSVYLVSSFGGAVETILNSGKQFSTVKWIGDRLYVADRLDGKIYVYNGDYGNGALITSITVSANPEQMFLVGDFLYVANLSDPGTTAKLDVIDVSKPDAPVLVESVTLGVQGAGFLAYYEGYIYVSGHFGSGYIDVVAVPRGRIDPYCRAAIFDQNGVLLQGAVGNVTGNVTGNLTGNVTGNVTGNLTGNVTGNVTGNLTGAVTGSTLNLSGVRAEGSNTTSTATDTYIRLFSAADVALHNPATALGQVLVIGEVQGQTASQITSSYTGFGSTPYVLAARQRVVLMATTYSGTAQWEQVASNIDATYLTFTAGAAKYGTGLGGLAEWTNSTDFGVAGTYAFLSEPGGETYVNAKSGHKITLRVANTEKALVDSAGVTSLVDFVTSVAGGTVKIKSGTNALAGIVTLTAGAGTISSTAIDANTTIVLTLKTVGGTIGGQPYVDTITPATGCTVAGGGASNTSTYNWVALKVN
jgi:hypothetical protein